MTEAVRLQESAAAAEVKEIDESIWQAWRAKNALIGWQGTATRLVAVKWASLGALLITAILWGHMTWYHIVIRFALCAGALVVAAQALRSRQFGFATVFAAITVIYNPVVIIFPMAGAWPLLLVALTVFAFAASLMVEPVQPEDDPRGYSASQEGSAVKVGLSAWEDEGGALLPREGFADENLKGTVK